MLTWQQRLAEAYRVEELVWVVKDFVASWHPQEIAALPPGCRPGRMVDADDIALYAFQLARAQHAGGEDNAALERMATFFAYASHRIAEILARAQADLSAANESHT